MAARFDVGSWRITQGALQVKFQVDLLVYGNIAIFSGILGTMIKKFIVKE